MLPNIVGRFNVRIGWNPQVGSNDVKILHKLIILMFSVLCIVPVQAGEYTISVAKSHHTSGDDHQSEHLILGYQNPHVTVHVFNNSYNDLSVSVGKTFIRPFSDRISGELYIGLVWGYEEKISPIIGNKISPYGWVGINYDIGSNWTLGVNTVISVSYVSLTRKF